MIKYLLPTISLIGFSLLPLQAEKVSDVAPLVNAASTFLESLDEEQVKVAHLSFESGGRENWRYVPKSRKGLAWRMMDPEQKALSWELFRVALSRSGQKKVNGVIAAETVLWERADHSEFRNPEKYHVSIFGDPKIGATWGASLEGHHLSINLTVVDGREVFVTPSFFGANPDRVTEGEHAGLRPLAGEADEAIQLLGLLDAEQRKRVMISDQAPKDILTKARRIAKALETEGLPASEMTREQQIQLRRVLEEYVDRYRAPYANDDWAKIEAAGVDEIHFAWAGSDTLGEPMYYRLQGPTFIMEYVNVQGGGNHAHTVWRDFKNDFGRDFLKEHLEAAH